MKKPMKVRCNKAYTERCPDKQRKHGCSARTPHEAGFCCKEAFPCTCDGGFQCKCVKYTHPLSKKGK